MEAARVEAAPVEAARVEAAPVEAAPVEAARVEAAPVEAARVEAAPAPDVPVAADAPVSESSVIAGPALSERAVISERWVARESVGEPFAAGSAPEPATVGAALPETYGRSRVVVLAIDPHHVHAYWEVTPADAAATEARLERTDRSEPEWVLRFHDVTGVAVGTASALGHFDIAIDRGARNWYVELWSPDKTYLVELGARLSNQFSAACQANPVSVPPAAPSLAGSPEWATADPEHVTSEVLAASDPRVPPTTRSRNPSSSGEPSAFAGEQPWIAAIRGLSAGGAERERAEGAGWGALRSEEAPRNDAAERAAAEAPPTSKTPPTRASTPHALSREPRGMPVPQREPAGQSRSISLRGLGAGSGAAGTPEPAAAPGGDSSE